MKYLMINLKSNKNLKEILEYKKELSKLSFHNIEFVLFPSSLFLAFFYDVFYKIGSQNLSIYESGPHTGEIVSKDIASLKVSYCLLNHAEAKETIENIKIKIKNATKEKIKVVLCIREKEKTTEEKVIREITNFLKAILNDLKKEEQENIILAYEPAWFIGNTITLNPKTLEKICVETKEYLKKNYNKEFSFLYGGGITSKNYKILTSIDKLDGILIGNSAKNPENIKQILENL